jgi:hypothetical protein
LEKGIKAIKKDAGKPRFSLLPSHGLRKTALVFGFGEQEKYDSHNWRKGVEWSRRLDSAMSHVIKYSNGENSDDESGLSHLAHAVAQLLMVLEYEETCPELDDRWSVNDG